MGKSIKKEFFNRKTSNGIRAVLERFMDGVLQRRIVDEPWDYKDYEIKLPFHVALVPEEIWKSAKFERSFVTSLGMIGWEEIAKIIAEDKRGYAERNKRIVGKVDESRLRKIQEILRELEHSDRQPDWESEFKEIVASPSDKIIEITVIADLYVEDKKANKKLTFEIKSPKPNSDQTKVSKEKMLKLLNLEDPRIDGAFFALPFNPYGIREKYAHSHPFRWFDMKQDSSVVMGDEFWNLLGGKGTFEALLDIFRSVGNTYKDRIREEYLDIK